MSYEFSTCCYCNMITDLNQVRLRRKLKSSDPASFTYPDSKFPEVFNTAFINISNLMV